MGKSIPRTGMRSSGESRRRSTDPAAERFPLTKVFRARVEREAAQVSALAALKERLFQGSTRMLLVEEVERLRQEVRARRDGGGR